VDERVGGVLPRLRHVHEFATIDGETVLTDTFEYTPPFGFLGHLADRLYLRGYFKRLLAERYAALKQMAEDHPPH
jgi:ligand-binding SRPBCC domain-containing protein